ncbi:MAG: NUDIX hydrolase [Patescibacteria group bacterium]|jgi:8-oxo-dGTP pyrophosphatase MutT (NUDIX family)
MMREINRVIVSALILSQDNKLLMGKKNPTKGGVYPDCWHIPGGGVDEGESFEQALIREVFEEVGINIASYRLLPIPHIGNGASEKTLKSGEKILCHMEFNRFKIMIDDQTADEIKLTLNGDLVEARWFNIDELSSVKQVPGGKELLQKLELIPK